MMGGYNITPLIKLLDINATAQIACDALSKTLLIYEAYQSIVFAGKPVGICPRINYLLGEGVIG
jgi:aconitate hydratase 2/2-methylisocitrate dehydratase